MPATKSASGIVKNGLFQSALLTPEGLRRFGLDHHNLYWKCVFVSSSDRLTRFISSTCRTLELFHKKLIVIQPDERLLIVIYVPNKLPKASEAHDGTAVRVFALPQLQGSDSAVYRVVPTNTNYRLFYDESTFQLCDGKRSNTFVFLTRGQMDVSSLSNIKNKGDRRKKKQATIDDSINFDCRASIAVDKISQDIQRHVGKVQRAGILAAVSFGFFFSLLCFNLTNFEAVN